MTCTQKEIDHNKLVQIMNVEEMARTLYGLGDKQPTKAQRNRVSELCRTGRLDAMKVGGRWLIRFEWANNHTKQMQSEP